MKQKPFFLSEYEVISIINFEALCCDSTLLILVIPKKLAKDYSNFLVKSSCIFFAATTSINSFQE